MIMNALPPPPPPPPPPVHLAYLAECLELGALPVGRVGFLEHGGAAGPEVGHRVLARGRLVEHDLQLPRVGVVACTRQDGTRGCGGVVCVCVWGGGGVMWGRRDWHAPNPGDQAGDQEIEFVSQS